MNRPQNLSVTTICKSPMWVCVDTHYVSGEKRGWVEETSMPLFLSNSSSYIAIKPLSYNGAKGYFRQLAHVSILTKNIIPLTHSMMEVRKLLFWDQVFNWM